MKKYLWAAGACVGVFGLGVILELILGYNSSTQTSFGWMFRQLCFFSVAIFVWRAIVKKPRGGVQMDKNNPGADRAETGNSSAKETLTTVNDDVFYDEVAKEMETNNLLPGVWTRAFAEADGDENRAKAIYIKRRVAQLAENSRQRQLEEARQRMPIGGDVRAVSWEVVNDRWALNTYANGDVTMSDKDTGRMWFFNANPCGKKKWADAAAYCDNLTYAGYSDWRLPDKDALNDQFCQKNIFPHVQNGGYWSGTSSADVTASAWYMNMYNGNVDYSYKIDKACVWPVRGGQ